MAFTVDIALREASVERHAVYLLSDMDSWGVSFYNEPGEGLTGRCFRIWVRARQQEIPKAQKSTMKAIITH